MRHITINNFFRFLVLFILVSFTLAPLYHAQAIPNTNPDTFKDPIIPKDSTLEMIVDRERFISSLRIVSSISSEKLRPVKLIISPGSLKLESEKADYGEVIDEIEIEYEGESFEIGFNSRYLLDVLSVLETKNVVLECKNSMSPTIIKSQGDESFLSVIMPLRVEW